ncbi:hypothetical protein J8F10_01660 [Gemmata sp. G18]|uniref:Uncharacterized protein n=1 Tax=Gemmata palustris TaxID=2822762 RepID=A0ABS5BJX2_9BACT|nr:hypothetical protein [Gemmata palustris]MBP3954004.1 hypothetical protein [Gemmata palustris]
MRITILTSVAFLSGAVGTGGTFAITTGNTSPVADEKPAPPSKDKPQSGDWLPELKRGLIPLPPSAFPDIVPPKPAKNEADSKRYLEQLAKSCPRLCGKIPLKIEDGDDTLRKLMKARLHQGILSLGGYQEGQAIAGIDPSGVAEYQACLEDVLQASRELWGKQPKEFVPWLEELLVEAKAYEQYTIRRVEAGAIRFQSQSIATRNRLKLEAELWKAKNPK